MERGSKPSLPCLTFASMKISNFASAKPRRVPRKPTSAASNQSANFGRRPGLIDFASTRRRGTSEGAVQETALKISQIVIQKVGDLRNGKCLLGRPTNASSL